jgi:hypothetical protein
MTERYDPFADPDLDDPADDLTRARPQIKPPVDHTPTAVIPHEVFEPVTPVRDESGRRVMSPQARLAFDEARAKLPSTTRRVEPTEPRIPEMPEAMKKEPTE